MHDFNLLVNVVGYDPSKATMTPNCRNVSTEFSYDFPMTGEVFIIEIHQAILIDHINNNLLCPMQMRMYYVKVDDIPKYLTENPIDQTHSIVMHEK